MTLEGDKTMKKFIFWVVVPTTLAAVLVSLPVVFTTVLEGWWGVVAGFGAAWTSALVVGAFVYSGQRAAIRNIVFLSSL
jgi:hypothetical protein